MPATIRRPARTIAAELDRLVGRKEAETITGRSWKTNDRDIEVGGFPPPVQYAGVGRKRRRPLWRLSELQAWVRGEWRP